MTADNAFEIWQSRLRKHGLDEVRRRAGQTAQAAAEIVCAPVIPEPRLRERWFGDLIGTSSMDLDWRSEPPNGESLRDFVVRTQDGFCDALDTEASTLLVAHGGPLYVLVFSL